MANNAVFNFRRNAGSDWISLTEVGREFQVRDPAAGNARYSSDLGPQRAPSRNFSGEPNLRPTVHVLQTIYDLNATTFGLEANRNHCVMCVNFNKA